MAKCGRCGTRLRPAEMAQCDYCGSTFRGWGLKHGPYNFCKGTCRDNGAVLDNLSALPAAEIDAFIDKFRKGTCPSCNRFCELDIHRSFRVYSIVFYTKWSTTTELSCQECARRRQSSDLGYCLVAGWWSFPVGPIMTIAQTIRNIAAMKPRDLRTSEIAREARLILAQQLAGTRP